MPVRSKKKAEMEQRRKSVSVNLLAGLTYRQMAEALGVSLGTVSNDVKIIMGRWQREQVDTVDGHVAVELQRLDRALNAIWSEVLTGDQGAIDRLLRIMDRRAKYLGLDAPKAVDVTTAGQPLPQGTITIIEHGESTGDTKSD